MAEKNQNDEPLNVDDLQVEPLNDEELEDAAGACWSIFCCSCEDCSSPPEGEIEA